MKRMEVDILIEAEGGGSLMKLKKRVCRLTPSDERGDH